MKSIGEIKRRFAAGIAVLLLLTLFVAVMPVSADTEAKKVVTEYSELWSGDITVTAGVPVEWYVNVPEGTNPKGCKATVKIPGLGFGTDTHNKEEGHIVLQEGENFIYAFTPEEPGDILFTCWMGSGCHHNYIHVVENPDAVSSEDSSETVSEDPSVADTSSGDVSEPDSSSESAQDEDSSVASVTSEVSEDSSSEGSSSAADPSSDTDSKTDSSSVTSSDSSSDSSSSASSSTASSSTASSSSSASSTASTTSTSGTTAKTTTTGGSAGTTGGSSGSSNPETGTAATIAGGALVLVTLGAAAIIRKKR